MGKQQHNESRGSLQRRFFALLRGDDSIRETTESSFLTVLWFPFRLIWGFLVFMIQAWSTSRSGFAFLRGMPALGILLVVPILSWAFDHYYKKVSLGPAVGYHQYYRGNQKIEDAKLFSQKMMSLEPTNTQFKYLHAENLAAVPESRDEGVRMMEWLARGEDGEELSKGIAESNAVYHAQANVWLSRKVLEEQRRYGFTEERNALAMKYLESASSDDVLARRNLADLYLSRAMRLKETDPEKYRQNLGFAKSELEDLTKYEAFSNLAQVNSMPKLIFICNELGEDEEAANYFQVAKQKIGRLTEFKTDMIQLWVTMVKCAIGVKDYDSAIEIMEEGFRTVKTPEARKQMQQLASLIYLTKADDFNNLEDEESFRERLYALCLAIRTNRGQLEIYQRLVDYIDVNKGSPQRDVWLRNMTTDSPSPNVVHIILGMRNLIKGDVVEARARWNIAKNQFAADEIIVYLLEVAVRQKREIGSPELVSKTFELLPRQYALYRTRAHAARNAQDYEQAIADFEAALKDYFQSRSDKETLAEMKTREFLIDCYQKVGNEEKARFHRAITDAQFVKLGPKDQELITKLLESARSNNL